MASAIAKGRREGKKDGRREGENRLLQLIQRLTEYNHADLIPRISVDTTYHEELYKKYGL